RGRRGGGGLGRFRHRVTVVFRAGRRGQVAREYRPRDRGGQPRAAGRRGPRIPLEGVWGRPPRGVRVERDGLPIIENRGRRGRCPRCQRGRGRHVDGRGRGHRFRAGCTVGYLELEIVGSVGGQGVPWNRAGLAASGNTAAGAGRAALSGRPVRPAFDGDKPLV